MVLWIGATVGWDGLRLSCSSEVEFRASNAAGSAGDLIVDPNTPPHPDTQLCLSMSTHGQSAVAVCLGPGQGYRWHLHEGTGACGCACGSEMALTLRRSRSKGRKRRQNISPPSFASQLRFGLRPLQSRLQCPGCKGSTPRMASTTESGAASPRSSSSTHILASRKPLPTVYSFNNTLPAGTVTPTLQLDRAWDLWWRRTAVFCCNVGLFSSSFAWAGSMFRRPSKLRESGQPPRGVQPDQRR